MKGKLIELNYPLHYYDEVQHFLLDKEYLILGDQHSAWLLLDENNRVAHQPKENIIITDDSIPDFWEQDPYPLRWGDNVFVPREWFYKLPTVEFEEFTHDYVEEIWNITQFAKGLLRYNLNPFPEKYRLAFDDEAKIRIINNLLIMAKELEDSFCFGGQLNLKYSIIPLPSWYKIKWENETIKKDLTSAGEFNCMEYLMEILERYTGYYIKEHYSEDKEIWESAYSRIRKRIALSIGALFMNEDFEIYYGLHSYLWFNEYVLKKGDKMFLLEFSASD